MLTLQLEPIANQSFSCRLDDDRYVITLKETRGVMSVTIARNDITIIEGARCVAGTPLLPYLYQEKGNFIFVTDADDLPDWTKFGDTQSLVYLTVAEIEAANAGT